MTEMMEKKKR